MQPNRLTHWQDGNSKVKLMLIISEKANNKLKSRIRIRIRIRIRTKITPDPQHWLQPGLPQAANSWSPGSCSVLYSCYSQASHGLRTWRHGFLVPWFMFCTLFLLQPGVPWAAHLATWIPGPLVHVLLDPHLPALHGARSFPLLPEPPAQAGNRMTKTGSDFKFVLVP